MALNNCSSTGRADGSEAGCEDIDAPDVVVGEVGKGDAVQSRWRQVLNPKLPFTLKVAKGAGQRVRHQAIRLHQPAETAGCCLPKLYNSHLTPPDATY